MRTFKYDFSCGTSQFNIILYIHICHNDNVSKYAPFHFYSCLKILIVNTSRFLRPFLKKTAVRYNRELESGNKMKVLKVLKDFFINNFFSR